jgi:CubicO group peptidase (beta-lactamase class C family)
LRAKVRPRRSPRALRATAAVASAATATAATLLLATACRTTAPVDSPAARPRERSRIDFSEVDRVIEAAIADGAFPGAVVAIGHRGKLVHLEAFGRQTYAPDAPAIETDTLFDIASLTKVVATTTVAMILVDDGKLDLDARVDRYLPGFTGPGKERVTVRHLLAHAAGIEWWTPLFREVEGEAAYVERIVAMPLASEPGAKEVYSDLGIILLGAILEQLSGTPLDRLVAERVLQPLGMNDTLYRPPAELVPRIAPTERDDAWRGRVIHGEVHDENAFAMGGMAPHAGLFSTATDLARFAQMMLDGGRAEGGPAGDHRIVERATIALFTRRAGIVPGSDRALGWDTKSAEGSTAGTLFSPSSFGHTGFTGTSLWIDPERDLYLILLTNRVHPTRENRKIALVRPAVADAVVRAIESPRR